MRGVYCSTEFLEKKNKEIQELKAKYENVIKRLEKQEEFRLKDGELYRKTMEEKNKKIKELEEELSNKKADLLWYENEYKKHGSKANEIGIENEKLRKENTGHLECIEKYKDICKQLTKQSQELKKENQSIKDHNVALKTAYTQILLENEKLEKEISELHRDVEHVLNDIIVEDIKNEAPEKATQIFRKILEHLLHDPSIVPDIDTGRKFTEYCLCHCESSEREGISEEDCSKGGDVGERR